MKSFHQQVRDAIKRLEAKVDRYQKLLDENDDREAKDSEPATHEDAELSAKLVVLKETRTC